MVCFDVYETELGETLGQTYPAIFADNQLE